MNRIVKTAAALLLTASLAAGLTACGGKGEDGVYAQSMASINGMGYVGFADRYAGLVTAGKTTEIRPDPELTPDEIRVEEGQLVKKGDVLFTYNNEAAKLRAEQARLDLESQKNRIASLNAQIAELAKERDAAGSGEKLEYTLEIQSLQADVREAEYNVSVKTRELEKLDETAADAEVRSETDGRVTAINRDGSTAEDGSEKPFMTIVETGNLRVKGRLNELNRGAVTEGMAVTVRSRTDDTAVWQGTVRSIDWENPQGGSNLGNGYAEEGADEMTSASSYPFYVELEDPEGLVIGQHVYIEPGAAEPLASDGLRIPAYLVMEPESAPWVWAAKGEKLEKRAVTLGELDPDTGEYAVEAGLTAEDYVAFPEDGLREGMAVIRTEEPVIGGPDDGEFPEDGSEFFEDDGEFFEEEGGSYEDGGVSEEDASASADA